MKPALAVRTTLLTIAISLSLAGCGESDEMSQEEIQYLSHLDQSRFFQRQGELKASTLEARSAIEMQPNRVEPYLVIINNLLTAGDAKNAERQLDTLMSTVHTDDISTQSLNDAALVRAEANLMQQEYDDALKALEDVKDADRVHQLEATLLRGHILLASGKPESARESYEAARDLDPNAVEPLVGLSKVAFSQQNDAEVAEYIQQASELDAQNEELLLWKARLAHSEGRWEEAEQSYISALETIGQYDVMTFKKFETISALIDVLRQQKKSSEAFVYEEILAKSAPGTIRSNLIAAQEAFNKGDLETAGKYLEETLAQAPSHEQAALMLGIVRYRQGRAKEAEALLAPVAQLEESELAQKLLAATRLQLRNPNSAKEILANIDGKDSDPETLALVGIASLVSGDKESGKQFVEKSLELAPDNTSLRQRYAAYLIKQGETDEAIEQATYVLNQDPESDPARLLIIDAYASAGDFASAQKTAEQWIEKQPDSMRALISLGNLAIRAGDADTAADYFEKAASAEPESPVPLVSLGNLELASKNPEAAKAHFKKAMRLAPNDQRALRGLGAVMQRDELTAFMEELYAENPESIGPRLIMLETALLQENTERADQLTASLTERTSENTPSPAERHVANVYHSVASGFANQKKTDAAIDVLQRGRVLFPENEQIGLQAAILQFSVGDTKKARDILREVKQHHPESGAPFYVEARYFEQEEKFKQAAELYELALAKQASPELVISHARNLARAGQKINALDALEAAKADYPRHQQLLMNLAILQQQNGRTDAAAASYSTIVEVAPDNVVALNNLAWIYHERGDDRAVQLSKRAYEINPENAAVADTYGWILFKAGKTDESLPVLEKAHKLKPDSREIAMHLVEAYKASGRNAEAKEILEAIGNQS